MTALFYVLMYTATIVFLSGCAIRAYRYSSAPVHLRWELYPVPHEEPHRAEHGGSYFESVDWWKQPSHFNLWGELKFMVPEMAFLKGLWEFNRKMWLRSFPFHFGLYLLIGTFALIFADAAGALLVSGFGQGAISGFLHSVYKATGIVGGLMGLIGAVGLLHRRLTDRDLRNYTAPGDILNLILFIGTLSLLFLGFGLREPTDPSASAILQGLFTFDTSLQIPDLLATALIVAGLLAAYVPMTHMSHFIAKWFTYHSVRWDDQPEFRSARLAQKMAEYLTYKPTWAAPHVGADGTRTWVDIATTNPAQGVKK
jgi:nitrate reductase gamma subunit